MVSSLLLQFWLKPFWRRQVWPALCGLKLPTSVVSGFPVSMPLSHSAYISVTSCAPLLSSSSINLRCSSLRSSSSRCVVAMASSMAVRTLLLVLVVLATASQTNAQCNTTLLEAVRGTPQLSLLYSVIQASGLSTTVNGTDNVTVLAPDNNAFNGTNGLLPLLAANNLTLTDVTAPGSNRAASILLYHILPAPYFAANLTNGLTVSTLLGKDYDLKVSTTGNVTFVGAANNATVIAANIRVCNSVVHVVNRVLLPAANLTAIPIANTTASAPGSPPTVTVPPPAGSGASSLSAGSMMLAVSGAVAAALMM